MDFSLIGAIRGRKSINRSAQNNIAAFINALEHSSGAVAQIQHPNFLGRSLSGVTGQFVQNCTLRSRLQTITE